MEDILYTVSETAKLLKTNTNYVYELIKLGFLPALKLSVNISTVYCFGAYWAPLSWEEF